MKKEREKLIIAFTILLLVLFTLFFIHGTRYLPIMCLAAFTLILQLVVIPIILCISYSKVVGVPVSIVDFIPFRSELLLFNTKISMLSYIVLTGYIIARALAQFVDGAVFVDVSLSLALSWKVYLERISIILICFYFIVTGVGYLGLSKSITKALAKHYKARRSSVESLMNLLFFLPGFRIAPMLFLNMRLVSMNRYMQISLQDTEKEQDQLEEI